MTIEVTSLRNDEGHRKKNGRKRGEKRKKKKKRKVKQVTIYIVNFPLKSFENLSPTSNFTRFS